MPPPRLHVGPRRGISSEGSALSVLESPIVFFRGGGEGFRLSLSMYFDCATRRNARKPGSLPREAGVRRPSALLIWESPPVRTIVTIFFSLLWSTAHEREFFYRNRTGW